METLIATATFGLESIVARELRALGYEARATRAGWLSFRGDASAIARANLWLRASDRVLVEIGGFDAPDFGVLFDATRALEWERWLPADARVPVRGRSIKSQLTSVPACQRIVKKAIVERLKEAHRVTTLPEDGPTFAVEIALVDDRATLLVDTSGAALHKRGYRPLTGEAPIKETLAAGLILLSFWDRERPFLDPFCGTGTLPIEAALIARNRAPGISRAFAAETWPSLPERTWRDARDEARELETHAPHATIIGSDVDPRALAHARRHANEAGVVDDLRLERKPFADVRCDEPFGCLVTNPPYGERLGDAARARALYRTFPDVLRRFPTWSHYILTSSRELESIVGQKADRRRKLYNGRIECTYYQFFGPRPGGKPKGAAFGGVDEKGERQVELFENRLRKRARHLRKWPVQRDIDAYRLYDRDIKEVPLSVDRYRDLVLVSPPSERVTSRTKAQQQDWIDRMVRAVGEVLDVAEANIFVLGRPQGERKVHVREIGLTFEVRLDGAKEPGLALEGRLLRRELQTLAAGKRVLTVPSRAGTYSVAAAAGGAERVTSVDPDRHYHAWAQRNFVLNDVDVARHRFQSELNGSERYDLIVVDDPADNDVIERARELLANGGCAYVLVHSHRRLEGAEDVTDALLPEDFRSRRRVRFWRLVSEPGPEPDSRA